MLIDQFAFVNYFIQSGPKVIKLFMLNSTKHEIYRAHKCLIVLPAEQGRHIGIMSSSASALSHFLFPIDHKIQVKFEFGCHPQNLD